MSLCGTILTKLDIMGLYILSEDLMELLNKCSGTLKHVDICNVGNSLASYAMIDSSFPNMNKLVMSGGYGYVF